MSIEYKPYMRQALVVGQRIGIEGTDWYCFEACSLLGVTLETNIPVIDVGYGAMLAQTQLSLEFKCASKPKQGRTRIENDILTTFKKIGVDQLVGKDIIAVHDGCESCIIITADNSYVKLVAEGGYDGEITIESYDLTLRDLLTLGLIADDIWRAYKREIDEHQGKFLRQSRLEDIRKVMGLDNPV